MHIHDILVVLVSRHHTLLPSCPQGWGGLLTEVAAAEDGRLEPDVRLGLREEIKVGRGLRGGRQPLRMLSTQAAWAQRRGVTGGA